MPKTIEIVDLPTGFTYREAYNLLNAEDRKAVRESIIAKGTSKETFHRWLREDKVPFIWQKEFREQLNTYLNANGKNLK